MKKENNTMVMVGINQIKPYHKNPRKHTSKHIYEISRSIKEFGFTNPILIDENNEILAGHGRYFAGKEVGMTEVPCVVLRGLSTQQKKTYRIADNKLTEKGQWDMDLLKLEIEEIIELNSDFDLDLTCFEMGSIDNLLGAKEITKEDELPPLPKEPTTKLGDIWILGEHRMICGNSLVSETYQDLLGEEKASMIFTDPPYNVKIGGHVCGIGKIKHREFEFASGEMTESEFTEFLRTTFNRLKEYSINGSIHYICMDWRHIEEVMMASKGIYSEYKNLCVWNKDNGGMGAMYRSKHELIFVFKNGREPHTNNISLGKFGRYRTNVWDYAGVNSFGGSQEDLEMHPTVKPVAMIKDAIFDCSNRGEIILDAFLGSGSTLIAAEKTNRKCYGIEIDPQYTDVVIERWQKLTGKDAIHQESGSTYKDRKFWRDSEAV